MAAASVAVAVGTYMFLKLGFPHATEAHAEVASPAPAAPVLAASTAAPEAAPASEPAAEPASEAPAEPAATPEPATTEPAPTEVAAAEPEPEPAAEEPAAEPEPEPAPVEEPEPAPEPEPEPAKAPEPQPAPKPATKPAPAKTQTAPAAPAPKPAAKPAAPAAKVEDIKPWWGADRADRLSLLFASSAAYKKAVVLMFNAGFDNAASADKNIKVFDAGGKPVAGKWELGAKNPRMLTFPVPAPGRYRVVLNSALTDAQGRTLASTLQGPVQVQ